MPSICLRFCVNETKAAILGTLVMVEGRSLPKITSFFFFWVSEAVDILIQKCIEMVRNDWPKRERRDRMIMEWSTDLGCDLGCIERWWEGVVLVLSGWWDYLQLKKKRDGVELKPCLVFFSSFLLFFRPHSSVLFWINGKHSYGQGWMHSWSMGPSGGLNLNFFFYISKRCNLNSTDA